MFAEQTGRRRGGGVLRLTRAGWVRPMIGRMEGPLSWRSLAVPTLVALVVWAGFAGMLSLGGQISAIGTEPGQADWTLLARLILGATVIVAAAYALRIWAGRLDLIALIVWTVWFAFDAFDPVVHPVTRSDLICPPGATGEFAACYRPWVPGFEPMARWLVVSVAILVVGYLFRRLTDAPAARPPVALPGRTLTDWPSRSGRRRRRSSRRP